MAESVFQMSMYTGNLEKKNGSSNKNMTRKQLLFARLYEVIANAQV